jgi:glycosyltransferase involved in cell wall biosynthesis
MMQEIDMADPTSRQGGQLGTQRHVCVVTSAHPADDVRANSRMATAFSQAGYRVSWMGPAGGQFSSAWTPEPDRDYHLFRSNRTRFHRLTARFALAKAARGLRNVDWWYSPDPDAAAVAVRLARRKGGRVLFDVHEVFHAGLLDRWIPGRWTPHLLRELVRHSISRTCAHADLITGVSETVLAPYLRPGAKYVVARNCAPRFFAGQTPEGHSPHTEVVRIMHGKAVAMNGTMQVMRALARLDASVAGRLNVHLVRVPAGSFALQLERAISALPNPQMVTLAASVPHEAMPSLLSRHQVGLIAYQRDLGVESLPNRLFEYMASGLAILAPSYSKEIVKILNEERIGITADFEDVDDITRALVWLTENAEEVSNMGARAKKAYLERYNWDAEAEKLIRAMREVENN